MSDDIGSLAVEAFIYGFPLVEGVRSQMHSVSGPVSPVAAPVNVFGHARAVFTLEQARASGVVSPNADTLYSAATLDIGQEPLVLRLPEVRDRYYVFQFIDAWTNDFAYLGRRTVGETAGETLLLRPGWSGEAPAGMRVIAAPTTLISVLGRFLVKGADDVDAVHRLQDGVAVIPLSRYPDAPHAADRSFGDWPLPTPNPDVPDALAFWEQLRTWMQAYPPHPDDVDEQQRFAPLGLLEVESPYVNPDPTLAAALQAAEADARAQIDAQARSIFPQRNGWQDARDEFNYNTHFLGFGTIDAPEWTIADPARNRMVRAVAARQALFGNHAYEAYYPSTFVDADGEPLTGERRYRLHFDSPPPVDGFWSLTMYDAVDFQFVANPIDRYTIGDRTEGLALNADGSLDVWVQRESPGPDKEANWLPAPAGAFRPILRMYIPHPQAFDDGQWRLPPFERIA